MNGLGFIVWRLDQCWGGDAERIFEFLGRSDARHLVVEQADPRLPLIANLCIENDIYLWVKGEAPDAAAQEHAAFGVVGDTVGQMRPGFHGPYAHYLALPDMDVPADADYLLPVLQTWPVQTPTKAIQSIPSRYPGQEVRPVWNLRRQMQWQPSAAAVTSYLELTEGNCLLVSLDWISQQPAYQQAILNFAETRRAGRPTAAGEVSFDV